MPEWNSATSWQVEPSIAPHWNWNARRFTCRCFSSPPSIAPHWNWNATEVLLAAVTRNLQSHLTGIEIRKRICGGIVWLVLQSHLTGIEILLTYNRPLQLLFPSIAPHWNWNLDQPFTFWGVFSFNRTSLELKSFSLLISSTRIGILQSHLTGIEIVEGLHTFHISHRPSIAPHWNWNSWELISRLLKAMPSIAPHWNWNSITRPLYRTGIAPSIAPHWNWNIKIELMQ